MGDDENPIYNEFLSYLNVDFDALLKRNSDTKAWLKVDGTSVNYPVVQTTDNTYYLSIAFDDTYNKSRLVIF